MNTENSKKSLYTVIGISFALPEMDKKKVG
jgi:hypothetical protein